MGQLLDIPAADAAGKHAQADAAFQALRSEQAKRAERATLNSAGQAINAALRPAFEAGLTDAQPIKTTPADDWLTSLQPLGDAKVLVCYSSDGTGLDVDGAMINGELVQIDCFTAAVIGQWYRAIRAEESKAAEIEKWTAHDRSLE